MGVGEGEVGRWKWRINPNNLWNKREEENWESACRARVYVRTCANSRERDRKDGECMKRERNDGKRGWREYTGR